MKPILKIGVFFLAALIVSFLTFSSLPRNSLKVFDQPKGPTVKVEEAELAKGGFVAIAIWNQDQFLEIWNPNITLDIGDLGSSEYLPAGRYKDFHVFFFEPEIRLIPDAVFVVVVADDGDGRLDLSKDEVVKKTIISLY